MRRVNGRLRESAHAAGTAEDSGATTEGVTTVLPAVPPSVGAARRFVAAAMRRHNALPETIDVACLLTSEPVTLRNLPRIRDVNGMLEILSGLGATVEWLDPHTAKICAAHTAATPAGPRAADLPTSTASFAAASATSRSRRSAASVARQTAG